MLERSAKPEIDIDREVRAADAAELLDAVIARVPPRLPIIPEAARSIPTGPARDLFGKAIAAPAHEARHRRQFRRRDRDRDRA